MTPEEVARRFTYHAPKPGQPEIYQVIREQAKHAYVRIQTFEECIVTMAVSPGDEYSQAIAKVEQAKTLIEEAVFWANASIARSE